MTTCTCTDGTCDYCVEMCYYAQLDARLATIEAAQEDSLTERDFERLFDERFDTALEEADVLSKDAADEFIDERRVEEMIDEAIEAIDLDDYVKEDGLASEVASQLEDSDVVQGAAAGAAEGAMRQVDRYLRTMHELTERVEAAEAEIRQHKAYLQGLTFRQRLGRLIGGWQ